MKNTKSPLISGYTWEVFSSRPYKDTSEPISTEYWVTEDGDNMVTEDGDKLVWRAL